MAGGSGFKGLPMFEYRKFDLDFKGLDLSNLCMMYIFVLGAEKTGKTTLVDPLSTISTTDPFLPSFEHIGEFIRMTELGMVKLRLLELKIEHLLMPEILLTCRIRKHIFLFVFAFDDSTTLRFLYKNWIVPVKRVFLMSQQLCWETNRISKRILNLGQETLFSLMNVYFRIKNILMLILFLNVLH
ncbi:hypothetical protein CEXT_21151 [Caerostris extrusa]|uniref:Uncharacterized protein n=1 Tax=Caerostris extrusa TaxID=172846 RepID=A0AAV4W8I0_CAEEX|nr:hypothetical protein CEXT_21151 [Caerostris extrusa]